MHTTFSSQIMPLDEADAKYVEKARKSVEWFERWGKWLVAANFLIAAMYVGMSLAIVYIILHLLAVPGLLVGGGIGVGMIAGYFGAHGMSLFVEAILSVRGYPEARLLVKYHDALAVTLDRHSKASF